MYTIGEISKIVNISANTLRYYAEPISIYIHSRFKNHQEITKGVLNGISSSLNTLLPRNKISDSILNIVNTKELRVHYDIGLISFSIEFATGCKSIVAIGVPHDILYSI